MGSSVNFMTSVITAVPWLCALFGTFFIPRYSDKIQERRKIAAITFCIGGLALMASAFVSPYAAIIALCLAATAFFACQPVFWAIPTSLLSGSALAVSIGFINMFGAFFSFAAPLIRVHAENLVGSPAAGLVSIGSIVVLGALAIMALGKKGSAQLSTQTNK